MCLLLLLAATVHADPVCMSDGVFGCTVQTDVYRLVVDVREEPMVRWLDPKGDRELASVIGPWLWEGERRFATTPGDPRPHFHPLRSGPYLVELHIEQIVLRDGGEEWPGLAELTLYCHEDRVFVTAAFIRPEGEWVNRGMYVYPVPKGREACPEVKPWRYGLKVNIPGGVGVRTTFPEGSQQAVDDHAVSQFRDNDGAAWETNKAHGVGVCLAPSVGLHTPSGPSAFEPPADDRWEMKMGEALGYDPTAGVFRIKAQTSGTPEPPRSLRAGAHYIVGNDDRPRRFLIDQRDPWGGISGGILRDGNGLPLPTLIQFGLNFPELNQQAGEPGWATLTYPVELKPNETREIRAEHLYHALADRECMYLTSLDNIGDPLLLQTTVGRSESHTLTTGPYPGEHTPGNELRVNDFRRIYSRIVKRSVSAILPTFFGYYDEADRYQGLMPGFVTFRETGPFLTEYTLQAATEDGAASGELRVWQAAHSDMTRLFTDLSLQVSRTVRLNATREAPLFFLRHHAFNPMAFVKAAFTAADGSTRPDDLSYARTVVENGAPMGERAFGCLYRASNGIDDGIPCSDITGNPGFVVLSWDVVIGGKAVKPGAYVFCTGADDPDGAYARDMAIVPPELIRELPAGSHIRYRAVHVVYGDNASDAGPMELERQRWPLSVEATVGKVLSSDPPEIAAANGRVDARIEGGTDWLPVRLRGFDPGKPLQARRTDSTGTRPLGPGAADEPWYSAWRAGQCGFTLLVPADPGGGPVRIEAWQ
ncbi:MAG: hypothetical protein FJX75_18185 [Armatimonadetes bacterium]|nr:hypothetical protein [Armatimonadota bacterium]